MSAPTFSKSISGEPGHYPQGLRKRLPQSLAACLIGILALIAIASSRMAIGAAPTPPDIAKIDLATTPLYAAMTMDKPSMVLALSVEFPTVGAQYTPKQPGVDDSYMPDKEYLGYYDAESCYKYNDAPTETPAPGKTTADYKRFDRTDAAANRKCTDAFSGNFLNWASSSAIDMHRLALSGGDRSIDTPALTILQRAMIPDGNPECMWNNGAYFPAKFLDMNGGGSTLYWGAIPKAMITAAQGNNIYITNILNKIYFGAATDGTIPRGNCDMTSNYKLGSGGITTQSYVAPEEFILTTNNTGLPTGAVPGATEYCGRSGATCTFTGVREVWYGSSNAWRRVPVANGVRCGSSILGKPPGAYYETESSWVCYTGPYTRTPAWSPPADKPGPETLNTDGYFYARVQVCNTDTSGKLKDVRNYDFCKKYPGGNYKPTGVIQKYSDQMRFAAFGYLIDNSTSRYGGVLRAPMKYVGAKTYDSSGHDNTPSGGNPKAEWDTKTGVFNSNPDANDMLRSGVINYLNQFGRTGKLGFYKRNDPVGELHYEALRYLQGLSPSADAIGGYITPAMIDGFPYYASWDDPYGGDRTNASDYSCIKSNILVIGDINTHDNKRLPTANSAGNIPDINYWRSIASSFETNTAGTYVDGQGKTQTIANPNTPNPIPGGNAALDNQILGSAYWARTHDIRGSDWKDQPALQRPGLRVKTFTFDVNESGAQNNKDARRNTNQFFMAAKYGGFETDPANSGGRPYNIDGNPFKDQSGNNNNNVWQKANDPGEAGAYYVFNTEKTSPARDLLSAFDEIFGRSSVSTRSIAGGGMSTGSKITNQSVSYSAKFDTNSWSGDVVAEPITQNASHTLVVGSSRWSAAQQLGAMALTDRKIFVGQVNNARFAAAEFAWNKINDTLKAYLNKASPAATADTQGQDRLAYLRGDRSKEGAPFRVRQSLLGDIINSNVSYSGTPSAAFTGPGYAAFRNKYAPSMSAASTPISSASAASTPVASTPAGRTPAVFAGSNDGMLHAFNALTGKELFAYIPSWFGPRLSALTAATYGSNHQSYVDAPSVVGEAQVANTGADTDWKTVLVSGTGGGGSGLFALDVSDPSNFTAANVMWEFTRADDPDIGQVVGSPKIMKIKTSGSNATETYRWFAVVGSGVNNYQPENGSRYSATGQPVLFLLALDKPAGGAWNLGSNYFKVSVPIDADTAKTNPTGLANFSALYGAQGEMTDIYMGDLHGALWRLQFAGKAPADWSMNKLSFFKKGDAANPSAYPLYIARTGDATPEVQAIFAAPTVFSGPMVKGAETFYVMIGTGKYLESKDNASTTRQTVYAIYDNGVNAADSTSTGKSVISGRARLQAGAVDTGAKSVTVSAFNWGRPGSDSDTTARAGWYFDLPVTGERIDQAALNVGALSAVINSKIPASTGTGTASCVSAMGGGNQYVLTIANGAGNYLPSTLGLLGPPVLASSETDARMTPSDSTDRRIRTTTLQRLTQAQGGIDTSAPAVTITETVGRLSWRQIFNYQDTKSAP